MMGKRHLVVIPIGGGEFQKYPMKAWVREHPEVLPLGVDLVGKTAHQFRGMLKKAGWSMRINDDSVLMLPPDTSSDVADEFTDVGSSEYSEDDESAEELSFELEYQLRDFIASNLGSITVNGKRLSLYRSEAANRSIEFSTSVGPIDILAQDSDGALYVFELKRASSPDRAIGQLARYMGWLKSSGLAPNGVFGVIVSKTVSDNLRYAVSVVPNVFLFEYQVTFSVSQVSGL